MITGSMHKNVAKIGHVFLEISSGGVIIISAYTGIGYTVLHKNGPL